MLSSVSDSYEVMRPEATILKVCLNKHLQGSKFSQGDLQLMGMGHLLSAR